MNWSGARGAGGASFLTTVSGGFRPENPPMGSEGAPVTKVRNFRRSSGTKADMQARRSRKQRESEVYPCWALTCALRCSSVQQASSLTDAPMMMEASSFSDQIRHASKESNSLKAVRKAATCGAMAVMREASATAAMYSSTFEGESEMPEPADLSSICEWPGRVKSTHSCAIASADMLRRLFIDLKSSGSTSRRELHEKGAPPRTARQKRGCNCTSTRRLSKMHLATMWPSSRKRSRICCAACSWPLRSHWGSQGSGKSMPCGTPFLKSRGSELRRISATCA
mmetsp:Transcript_71406/g.222726  ORF Transcript_71406/g.222726 Transcript_71406/m.222726 type:complete len:282 (+) Transcript_71406:184-1029(+)